MVTMESVNVSLTNQRPTTPTSLYRKSKASQSITSFALISSVSYISDTIMIYNIASGYDAHPLIHRQVTHLFCMTIFYKPP
jgi:hypothetical protein